MQLSSVVILFLVGFIAAATAATSSSSSASGATFPASAEVFYWPLAALEPSLLARISYDPSTLDSQVVSYTPPDAAKTKGEAHDLVRIGLFVAAPAKNEKRWVGSLTSWSSLVAVDNHETPSLLFHLGPSEELYHVSLSRSSTPSSASVVVDFARCEPGPRAQLNRPVVLSPDGKGPEEVPEKSFLQK